MKIERLVTAVGRNGFAHKDLAAIKQGAAPNGFLFDGPVATVGFDAIVQPGSVLSVMLVLDDGNVAFGDCVDVIFAGAAGRDPVFRPQEHASFVAEELAPIFRELDPRQLRTNMDRICRYSSNGRPLHTALQYGLSQALLHAAALARRQTIAEVVAAEWGTAIAEKPIPILVSVPKTDWTLIDRMIMKQVDLLPHASFTHVANDLGHGGEKLLDFAGALSRRIREIGASGYRPKIHLDTYGTIGELFDHDVKAIASFIGTVAESAAPFDLLIESPIIAKSRQEQIDLYATLRRAMREAGTAASVIVDEWCNTIDDIRAFGEADAADAVQIKAPDLGSLDNTIDAVLYCHEIGMGCCLGGTANETDQSARITSHVALATGPNFLLSKPGLGGDEALMILGNEMNRTLALLGTGARTPAGNAP
ncbi:methylaspartate ammonia-lyase [Aquamicrobium sp. LC103]|uniref:methylaspartate ammonia-lyase n=1 Tax=Aquamicrobium sp. LC103 TaxID=1120658 RepID=UPI00063EA95A|nr:methylaspartate ammonia-lyase [Aquamicrobium sp. LC103]TKT78321.1 methylaspartate ammonia-lyase [Aquamicrobium sp. LC103]